MKEIKTYDEKHEWESRRKFIAGICGNDTADLPDKLCSLQLYRKNDGGFSTFLELDNDSWFVHDFKLPEHIETWKIRIDNDGFEHHCCPKCNKDAIFHYITEESWDEDCDGNWQSCGTYIFDIEEWLTPFCPFCGTQLEENEDENEDHE